MIVEEVFDKITETFTLDAVANRKQHSKTSGEWQYDQNNRLKQKGNGSCGSSNTTCYQWDERGNLTQKQEGSNTTNYGYDSSNRLTEVRHNHQLTARYGYDPFNRRLWKEQYRDKQGNPKTSPQRTYYLYSDEGLIGESTQTITIAGETVTANTTPEISTQYGPTPDSLFSTHILFAKTKNSNNQPTIAYYHYDHLSTPMQATDKAGNVVWSASYEAFGKATITTPNPSQEKPTITSNLRFPGQYEDEETGLHYNFNRYYDAETGRYITSDPIGLEGGDNTYAYVLGSPVVWADVFGLKPGDLFETMDDAVIDMWLYILANTGRRGSGKFEIRLEYANEIIKVGLCFTYTVDFQEGTEDRMPRRPKPPNYAGGFHSHTQEPLKPGDPSTRFSQQDLNESNRNYHGTAYVGYLEDTGKRVRRPDGTNSVITCTTCP